MSKKRKPPRRRSKGFLIKMRDAPARPSRRQVSAGRRALEWIGGIVAAVVILGAVGVLIVRFIAPTAGAEIREATVRIDDAVSAEDSGLDRPVPVVLIENVPTWLRDPPVEPVDVAEGTKVHVVYEWLPVSSAVRVQSWGPAAGTVPGGEPEGASAPAGDEPAPSGDRDEPS